MANYIRFDWMIKRLLRNKADFAVLEGFMSVLLEHQIHITKILESEANQDEQDQKFNRVDALVEDETGAKYIIEVQNDHEIDYFQRMLFGTSKVISQYTKLGDAYGSITKVYSINIVYFSLGQGKGYIYKGTTEFKNIFDKNDVLQLTSKQQELYNANEVCNIFPEYYILKVNNFNEFALSPLQQWVSVLKTGDIPIEFNAPGLDEARDVLNYDKLSPEEKNAYNRYVNNLSYQKSMFLSSDILGYDRGKKEGLTEGHSQGLAEGLAEGEKSKAIAIAKKMKSKGMSVEDICELTGLNADEILKLN